MRKSAEDAADAFDAALCDLATRADTLAERHPEHAKTWKALYDQLSRARAPVRCMMTDQQRKAAPY